MDADLSRARRSGVQTDPQTSEQDHAAVRPRRQVLDSIQQSCTVIGASPDLIVVIRYPRDGIVTLSREEPSGL
jgi:hypothetical protein